MNEMGPYLEAYLLPTREPHGWTERWASEPSGGFARFIAYEELRIQRDALLAVAKAASTLSARPGTMDGEQHDRLRLAAALGTLDAAHPDWRTWGDPRAGT